jgi:AbrB family looped-hinge helix DNA binding protein
MVGTLIATIRMTTRGRISVPKMVRELLNLRAGDQVDYKRQPDGSYRIRKVKQRIQRAK